MTNVDGNQNGVSRKTFLPSDILPSLTGHAHNTIRHFSTLRKGFVLLAVLSESGERLTFTTSFNLMPISSFYLNLV